MVDVLKSITASQDNQSDRESILEGLEILNERKELLRAVLLKAGPSNADVDLINRFFAERGQKSPFPGVAHLRQQGMLRDA